MYVPSVGVLFGKNVWFISDKFDYLKLRIAVGFSAVFYATGPVDTVTENNLSRSNS